MNTRETIENYFAILNGGKGDFVACLDEKIHWHLPPHHPFGADFRGKEQVLTLLARGMPMFEDGSLKIDLHCIVAEGENAFAHFTMRARTAAGRDYENQYLFRFCVRAGKIVELWESMDTLYMSGLGMYDD